MADEPTSALPAATDPARYTYWLDQQIRFADLDVLGHVNNKAFLTYTESARAAFLIETGLFVPAGSARLSVVARVEVDYRQELHYPGTVRVGLCVLEIGRSSYRLSQGLFRDDQCVATQRTTMVRIDAASRRTTPLNDEERAVLERYLAR